MELSTTTEDDCYVSREETRQDCERLAVDKNAARTVSTSSYFGSWPTSAIKYDTSHKLIACLVTTNTFDFRLPGICSSELVHNTPSSRKRQIADRVQAITFPCAGKSDAAFEVALPPAKGPATGDVPGSQGRRAVEPTSLSRNDLFWKAQFTYEEEFYG